MISVTWNIDPGDYFAALTAQQAAAIEADIVRLVESLLDEAQNWLRANHRWQNVTGAAEQGLYTDLEHIAREYVALVMSHGPAIEYAWALEANPRTALLGDAVDRWWPVLQRGAIAIVAKHSS